MPNNYDWHPALTIALTRAWNSEFDTNRDLTPSGPVLATCPNQRLKPPVSPVAVMLRPA